MIHYKKTDWAAIAQNSKSELLGVYALMYSDRTTLRVISPLWASLRPLSEFNKGSITFVSKLT